MKERLDRIFEEAQNLRCEVCKDEPMSKHTSFKIGGAADIFVITRTQEQTSAMLKLCSELDVPCLIVGKGSNLLISDHGIRGVVLRPSVDTDGIYLLENGLVEATAGAALSALCQFSLEHGLTGLEFAWGIPGSVGGALYMNAGAYGGEIKDAVVSAVHLDKNGDAHELLANEMNLSYRHSIYAENGGVITKVRFGLEKGEKSQIKSAMDDVAERRRSKQPLEYPSAGSVFKRPSGKFAAALIEQCGLKGYRIGGAEVSSKHSGFIINAGGATCQDVLDLVAHIQKVVLEQTDTELVCEIKMI